jgi:hypothetical protein
MDIGSLPQLLIALFKGQGTDLLQPGKDQATALHLKPGAQYEGKVLDALPNGRNLIQVDKHVMDMALPQQAKPGDVVRLTFLTASPRPTFVLTPATAAGVQPVNVSQAAQQVNALIRYVPVSAAGQAVPSTPAQGGPAGAAAKPLVVNPAVLLAPSPTGSGPLTAVSGPAIPALAMAGEAVEAPRASLASNTSLTTQGVVAEKTADGQVLPQRLQQTVKESGLFYESHLGRWVKGELPLDVIQREPQARLAQAPGAMLNVPDLDGMPEEAARMASRQLHMLEGGPFVWQGQAWPGQMLEWQVRDGRGEGNGDRDPEQPWHSRMRLTLPRLGEVNVDMDIGARGLRIHLLAASPDSLAEMRAALPELAARMRTAELNLTRLQAELADGQA